MCWPLLSSSLAVVDFIFFRPFGVDGRPVSTDQFIRFTSNSYQPHPIPFAIPCSKRNLILLFVVRRLHAARIVFKLKSISITARRIQRELSSNILHWTKNYATEFHSHFYSFPFNAKGPIERLFFFCVVVVIIAETRETFLSTIKLFNQLNEI